MSMNESQISYAGKSSIDFFLRNDPVDNVNTVRPYLKMLMDGKQNWGGGLANVVEQLHFSNDSNFQLYYGSSQVTYNVKRTLNQAKYGWAAAHDGYGLDEDTLAANGIAMSDDRDAAPTVGERSQLTNLLEENNKALKEGYQENLNYLLLRDGTQDTLAIPGLDAIVSLTPSTGIVGTIDPATDTWWRNYADATVTTAADDVSEKMQLAWQACIRVGGAPPDTILMGQAFMSVYRKDAKATMNRQLMVKGRGGTDMDAGVNGVYFNGVECKWDPTFEALDVLDSPVNPWSERCYMLNSNRLKLRPIQGHWLVPRKPPRVYDRYVHYWAMTAKMALTTGKRNAHAVLRLA